MTRAAEYRSDRLRSVHEAMKGIHRVGGIDEATMRRFDRACQRQVGEGEAGESELERRRRRK